MVKVRSKSHLILTPVDSTCLAGLDEMLALGMIWCLIAALSKLKEPFKADIVLLLDYWIYPNAEVYAPLARGLSGNTPYRESESCNLLSTCQVRFEVRVSKKEKEMSVFANPLRVW